MWPTAVGTLALLLLVGGCGIPTNDAAKAIPKSDVPFHLLDPATTSTTGPTGPPAVGVAETIFLVAPTQHVIPVSRDVPVPATLTEILGALLTGPTAVERAAGIETFVSGNRTQVSASVAAGVATVNFAVNPLQVVGASLQTLAIAQIVYTATQQPGVIGVVFHIAGQATPVPVASGAQVARPVNRGDYVPQAPLP